MTPRACAFRGRPQLLATRRRRMGVIARACAILWVGPLMFAAWAALRLMETL
jgi:hypothetical protein